MTPEEKAAIRDATEIRDLLALCDGEGKRSAQFVGLPEDGPVLALCEKHGYGAVMDSAARQWFRKDPIGAFTVGPCAVLVRDALRGNPAASPTPPSDTDWDVVCEAVDDAVANGDGRATAGGLERAFKHHELVVSHGAASPSGAMEWRAITKNDVGKTMLVTNNLHAQNARGDMSHKWIGWIQESNDPKWGDYICFDEADRRITGLTHCAPIPAPPRLDQAGEGKS